MMTVRELTAAAYKCAGWHRYPDDEPNSWDIIIFQKKNGTCGYGLASLIFSPNDIGVWKSLAHVPAKCFKNHAALMWWFQYEALRNPRAANPEPSKS